MDTKARTSLEVPGQVARREGEKSALRESERILPMAERIFLRRQKEKEAILLPKSVNVWFVKREYLLEGDEKWAEEYVEKQDALHELAKKHNKQMEGDADGREYHFVQKEYNEMCQSLREKYRNLDMIRDIPEIIILSAGDNEGETGWVFVPQRVEEVVDDSVDNIFDYWDSEIRDHLGGHLFLKLSEKFEREKMEISEEILIEYGLVFLEEIEEERFKKYLESYMLSGDKKWIDWFLSDDVLHQIYASMCSLPEESIDGYLQDYEDADDAEDLDNDFYRKFRVDVDHESVRRMKEDQFNSGEVHFAENEEFYYNEYEEDMNAAIENYWKYREKIAEFAHQLSFEDIKEKMRSLYGDVLKKELDTYTDEYLKAKDLMDMEKKLLKPILVHISSNPLVRELMREQGVEIALDHIEVGDMQKLIDFVSRFKASASSMIPQKLQRVKSDFYKSVEKNLDDRSEITADTEKELELLDDIFQRAGNIKKILDVGCGNGRIDIPLAEKGYDMVGIDGNENFLQDALRKKIEKELAGVYFIKGDIMTYEDLVPHGKYDAVIYTWHSILEAFGVGNLLHTLGNAYLALRPGGTLVFDQPTRSNPHMEDGWYGNDPDSEHQYLSYIMDEEEIRFVLKLAGFDQVEIKNWRTQPSQEYPEGMDKFTVSAKKLDMDPQLFQVVQEYAINIKRNQEENKKYLKAERLKRKSA